MKMFRTSGLRRAVWALAIFAALACGSASYAADTLNVYTIWSERYATEVFKAFTKDTGIQVRHLRFSSGEVLARIIGEKDNPQIDVFFGGIADAFVAGKKEGVFEAYVPKGAEAIPAKYRDPEGYWTGAALYDDAPAVTDGNVITAPGTGALEFALHIFRKLDVFAPDVTDAWYNLFKTGRPEYFKALMRMTQEAR